VGSHLLAGGLVVKVDAVRADGSAWWAGPGPTIGVVMVLAGLIGLAVVPDPRIRWQFRPAGRSGMYLVFVAVPAAVCVVIAELASADVRRFFVERPLTAGIVSGGLILAPAVFVLERFVERLDQQREAAEEARAQEKWREPAREAIETYMNLCSEMSIDFELMITQGGWWKNPQDFNWRDFRRRVEEDIAWLIELSDVLLKRTSVSGPAAAYVATVVAHYPPLHDLVRPVAEVQGLLRQASAAAGRIRELRSQFNQSDMDATEIQRQASKLTELLEEWHRAFNNLALRLQQVSEELHLTFTPR
jgi:hypothetical protein